MDRLYRVLASGSLVLALGALGCACGCRSMRSEVPAGKPYSTTGSTPPAVGFSSSPRGNPAYGGGQWGTAPTAPGSSAPDGQTALSGSNSATTLGTPGPNSSPYGAPVGAKFGGPSTNSGYSPTSSGYSPSTSGSGYTPGN
jgi:hypothetical protein